MGGGGMGGGSGVTHHDHSINTHVPKKQQRWASSSASSS
jgi:hypothetical protein